MKTFMGLYLCEALLGVLIYLFGSCIFSFLNVIIYRVPRKMSFVAGRSICPTCGHTLGGLDLVPVFSYLFLGGKCRYCKTKIGARDTLIEFFGGLAALFCAWYYQREPLAGITVFAFFCILTVVAVMDVDTLEIQDGSWIAIFVLAVISYFTMPGTSILSRVIGVFCVSVPMLILTLIISGAFGGGDICLMAACGAFLGWKLTLISMAFAILGGGIWGIYLMAVRKKSKKEHFAFGPFLCLGMVLALFVGEPFVNWYLGFLSF